MEPLDIPSDLSETEVYCLSDQSELVSDLTVTLSNLRVLATVKNSVLNAVFPITMRSQFPNLGQPKIVIEIQCC